jgi:hypothetical protein
MKKNLLFFVSTAMLFFANAQDIHFSQIQNWTGSGNNVSMLVIDFNDGVAADCWAFGYRWDGTKTAEDMLNDIAAANADFSVAIGGGFLNDISWGTQTGVGGSPNYWSTFVFNGIAWEMNWDGIGEVLTDSMYFACSYTSWYQGPDSLWYPEFLPGIPTPAPSGTGILTAFSPAISIYPNPCSDYIALQSQEEISKVEIFTSNGSLVISIEEQTNLKSIDVRSLQYGVYFIRLYSKNDVFHFQFVKNE